MPQVRTSKLSRPYVLGVCSQSESVMPIKLRCKRYFVLETSDGPLVTVQPTLASFLPESFKKATVRSLSASRGGGDVLSLAATAPRKKPALKGAQDGVGKDDDDDAPTMHRPGGPVLVFASAAPCPDSFGTTTDETEIEKRERLGVLSRRPCALCRHSFDDAKLVHTVSLKAIVERQAMWGRVHLQPRDLKPANLYEGRKVCLFCFQFFEEAIAESSSLLESDEGKQNLDYRAFSPLMTSINSKASAGDSGTTKSCKKDKAERRVENHQRALDWGGPSPLKAAALSFTDGGGVTSGMLIGSTPAPENMSPPEFALDCRVKKAMQTSTRLLRCLDSVSEARERKQRCQRFRRDLNFYRTSEKLRWQLAVETARRHAQQEHNGEATADAPQQMSPPVKEAADCRSILMTTLLHHEVSKTSNAAAGSAWSGAGALTTSISAEYSGSATLLGTAVIVDGAPVGEAAGMMSTAADVAHESAQSTDSDDGGELEIGDELRAVLAATPRSGRQNYLNTEQTPLQAARERLKREKAERDARGVHHQSSSHRSPLRAAGRVETHSCALRRQANERRRILSEEQQYLRDCERRGLQPSSQRLLDFRERYYRVGGASSVDGLHAPATDTDERRDRPASSGPVLNLTDNTTIDADNSATTLAQHLKHHHRQRQRHHSSLVRSHSIRWQDESVRKGLDMASVLQFHGSKRFSMYSL